MNTPILHALRFPLVAILAFSLVRCGENKAAVAAPAEMPIPVKMHSVVTLSKGRTLQYSGLIASNGEARLSFKVGGIISRVYVKEGDHAVAGQLLATLDLTEIDAQVTQAEQNLQKAQRDAGRLSNLYKDTVASLESLQNSHTQLSVATEVLRIARFNRQYAQIRAASGGTILQKLMNEGEYASPGAAVLVFNDTESSEWVVRFGVADKDWAVLHKGDAAKVYIDAYPDQPFLGKITKLAEGADPNGGTYAVEVTVSPNGHRLAPGLFCTLQLQPPGSKTFSFIPASALSEGDGTKGYVYTLTPDQRRVKKIPIRLAFFQDSLIAVSSGLDSVQQVVSDGVGYLTDGAAVKIISSTSN